MTYLPRSIASKVNQLAKLYTVILITGPRQTGKTTLARNMFPTHEWVLLDSAVLVEQARQDPALFLKNHPVPIILDEVQRAPELFQELKNLVDKKSPSPGSIILTGSQPLHLMRKATESLSGRIGILELSPMTQSELNQSAATSSLQSLQKFFAEPPIGQKFATQRPVTESLFRGGFPAMALPELSPEAADVSQRFNDYIATYLNKDLRELAQVHQLGRFERFIRILATTSSRIANINELAGQISLAQSTAVDWQGLLQASGLILELPAYHTSQIKRESRRPKIILCDSGLMCSLLGYQDPSQLEISPLSGAIFETAILNSLITLLRAESTRPALYHWRSSDKDEVDAVIEVNNTNLCPVEIKLSSKPKPDHCAGLKTFMNYYKTAKQALLITAFEECFWVEESILHLPWAAF